MFKETQTYSFTTTRKIARDQAPHWGKKEKNTGAREKKFGWRIFFLPLVDIFPISPPFFCLFPPPQSLVPGYAQDDAIHNKVPSIGRQTKNAPITNTVKTTSSFRNAMVLLPFKWNPFDRTSVKNYLFSSYLKKGYWNFCCENIITIRSKRIKPMVKKKFIYPWSTREFHSTLTITFEVSLKSIVVTEEVPILNVRLLQKYLPKRVVSGRRCLLLVIKLSRCLEITCKWLTAPNQTNICLSEVQLII